MQVNFEAQNIKSLPDEQADYPMFKFSKLRQVTEGNILI